VKIRLLELLRCPDCAHERLELAVFASGGDRVSVHQGELRCSGCGARLPIIAGIPRLLPAALRPYLATLHPEFFAQHPELVPPAGTAADQVVARTLLGFSFQHVRLADPAPERDRWRQNLLESIPVGPEFFRGRLGADVGCGAGRHAWWAHEFGAEVVALDLSAGVDVAQATLADCPRAHVVQGDIYHLPLRLRSLDFALSLGVVHHLPDPATGIARIAASLRPGGRLVVWVYGLEGMRWWYRLSHLTPLRPVTRPLPRRAQHALSVAIAAALELTLWAPARAASRLPGGARLAARLPLSDASRRPFVAKVRSVFDRVHPPVSHYPTAEELAGWLRRARLTDVAVRHRDGRGWIGTGRALAA